jgi:hypothetical protein
MANSVAGSCFCVKAQEAVKLPSCQAVKLSSQQNYLKTKILKKCLKYFVVQEGRADAPSDGYVKGYKHKGTYDKDR